jgi:hypothetical protein
MIVWFRDSKNDAKKGIWGEIVKLFAFASTIVKFGKNDRDFLVLLSTLFPS